MMNSPWKYVAVNIITTFFLTYILLVGKMKSDMLGPIAQYLAYCLFSVTIKTPVDIMRLRQIDDDYPWLIHQ